MTKLNECQNKLIGTVSKEIYYDGNIMLEYYCDLKKDDDTIRLIMLVDKEDSPMHSKCLMDGIELICHDCRFYSSNSV